MYYVYDVDMTLVESDCAMTPEMADAFRKAMAGKSYFFCSGSALPKMKEQIPADIIENAAGLLPVMGGELWQGDKLAYRRKFVWPEGLRDDLEEILANSTYPERTGDHIQDRKTMICFSTVGKAADMPARKRYEAWESEHNERVGFAETLAAKYPALHFSIGGKTSVDISEHGNDKSQALSALREYYGSEPVTFFGDRMYQGGNDYPLAEALKAEDNGNVVVAVQNPEDTLQRLLDMAMAQAS
ncbi:MAG: HAD-IIB family hydrolase [Pseudomonadota bacterium]|nr:HAD-IIB family hydrolase [Pseudomonadota bacterium]